MTAAIQTWGLSKRYGNVLAVDAVDLRVDRGEIDGFLGLNGAGKTTTIRALLGMIRPSAGGVSLFGESIGPGGRGPWRRVGHLVETPAAYPELTVRENLEVARRLHGVAPETLLHRHRRGDWGDLDPEDQGPQRPGLGHR
jgi:ABC-2 type transport system ATP-binding protein